MAAALAFGATRALADERRTCSISTAWGTCYSQAACTDFCLEAGGESGVCDLKTACCWCIM